MSIIQNPITGWMKGKYSNAVFTTLHGKNIMKAKAFKIHNPKTKKQMKNRNKMAVVTAYLKSAKTIIKVGWIEEAVGRYAFNAATSYHLMNAVVDLGGEWAMDIAKIMNAKGSLVKAENLAATNPSGQVIEYTWDDNSGEGNAQGNDLFCYVIYNITLQKVTCKVTDTKRMDKSFTIDGTLEKTGHDVAVYGFFVSKDGFIASDDSYLGTFVMK